MALCAPKPRCAKQKVSQVADIRVWRIKSPAIFKKIGEQQTPVEKQPGTFRTGNQFEKPNLAQQISDSRPGTEA